MHVPDLKPGPLSRQAAGPEGREAALVGQLGQGVVLIHELGQGRGAEELLDRCDHRPDIDQRLGGDDVHILRLQGHAFPDDPLHPGEPDAELVLQQLAHRPDPAVAQMVDVVDVADVVAEAVEIVDGREDIIHNDMVGHQLAGTFADGLPAVLLRLVVFQDLLEDREADPFVDAQLPAVEIDEAADVHHTIRNDLDFAALAVVVHHHIRDGHTGVLEFDSAGTADQVACLIQNLAGQRIDDRAGEAAAGQPVGNAQLFIVFIPAHPGQVVPPGVEKQALEMLLGIFHGQGLAGAELAVDLEQRLLGVLGDILFNGGVDPLVVPEEIEELGIGAQAQRPHKHGHGQLAVFIDPHVEHVGGVGFILQPCAPVGDDGGGEELFTGGIVGHPVIHAGGTDELGNDDPLGAVDDEGAAVGHQGEIAHEDFGLFDFAGFLVEKAGADPQRGGVGHVPFLALLNRVFRSFVQPVIDKLQHQVARVIGDGRNVAKHLFEALVQKPVVGILLDLDQVGHVEDFIDLRKAHARRFAQLYRFDIHHSPDHSCFPFSFQFGRTGRPAGSVCVPRMVSEEALGICPIFFA